MDFKFKKYGKCNVFGWKHIIVKVRWQTGRHKRIQKMFLVFVYCKTEYFVDWKILWFEPMTGLMDKVQYYVLYTYLIWTDEWNDRYGPIFCVVYNIYDLNQWVEWSIWSNILCGIEYLGNEPMTGMIDMVHYYVWYTIFWNWTNDWNNRYGAILCVV